MPDDKNQTSPRECGNETNAGLQIILPAELIKISRDLLLQLERCRISMEHHDELLEDVPEGVQCLVKERLIDGACQAMRVLNAVKVRLGIVESEEYWEAVRDFKF